MWFWFAEPFLYLSFAIGCGYVLLYLVPEAYRPVSNLSSRFALFASLGIGFFSFFPILRIVSFFGDDVGWLLTFQQVLFSFNEGRIFIFTLVASIVLGCLAYVHGRTGHPQALKGMLLCLVLLILAQGWSSHIASWYGSWGVIAQTLHIWAVALWAGPLLLAGWHPQPTRHWTSFLGWYHPLAILCMLVIASSGFVLTNGIAPEYVNAWKLSYGQALLIKHILLVPLALFAIANGFWVKHRLQKDPQFRPQIWAKTESFILILIFTVTGFMNQQPAPHDVSDTLNESPASPLYLWFSGGQLDPESDLLISLNTMSISMFVAALVPLSAAAISIKNRQPAFAVMWSLISAAILYYGAMLIVS
ncbi:copper resistance D family protein [Paenibacillus sp. 1P07SE]|uniref:copper resistance D family protein n=1 Tax=Paenibacillus sp. 1P07SE TaxID=3132209 RepID=UPI0039A5C0C4